MKFTVKDTPSVLFCDNHLLVLVKPHGLLTQPSGTTRPNLEEWGKAYLKKKFDKPGAVFLEALHRLDKEVSGIVLFARTSKALTRLQESQREGKWRKKYWALIEGHFVKKEDLLEDHVIHGSFRAEKSEKGAYAALRYTVLKEELQTSLLDIELLTGRYHQIRLQLSSRGHPIVGDRTYGSQTPFAAHAIALTHYQLETVHPIGEKKIVFSMNG
jgi:23S rRNA pseudouridine1911/1915/1917 synthase